MLWMPYEFLIYIQFSLCVHWECTFSLSTLHLQKLCILFRLELDSTLSVNLLFSYSLEFEKFSEN